MEIINVVFAVCVVPFVLFEGILIYLLFDGVFGKEDVCSLTHSS